MSASPTPARISTPFASLLEVDGPYALLVGEGVEPRAGAIDALVALAERTPDAGAIGARLVGPDGRLVQAGGITAADGSVWSYGAGRDAEDPRYLHVRAVDWASTDLLLVRTEALRAAGGLATDLGEGAARAADLGLRLRAAGFRVLYQPEAVAVVTPGAGALPAAELDLTVVIPTHNRAALLRDALESLAGQTLAHDRFEVVVVDDGSTDETPAVCAELAARLPVRHLPIPNSGIAAAKNAGVRAARGRIVAFFDDDDLADAGMLAEHLRVHEANPEPRVAVLGYTDWDRSLEVTPLMRYVTDVGQYLFSYGSLRDGQRLDYTYFWGGRSSAKRDFLLAHGLFDPTFTFGSEDIELGYRLSRHGLEVVFARNAVSHMNRALSLDDFLRRSERQGRSQVWFSRLHPDPGVQRWCGVQGAEERWDAVAGELEGAIEAASSLLHADGPQLHARLRTAIDAMKLKGIVEELRAGGGAAAPALRHDEPQHAAALRSRWAEALRAQTSPEPALMRRAANRAPGRRVFASDLYLPAYDRASGSRRLFEMLRLLAAEGHAVTFVATADSNEPHIARELRAFGVETYVGDAERAEKLLSSAAAPPLDLAGLLAETDYDVALLSLWYIAAAYLPELRRHAPRTRVVVDTVDVHFVREERQAALAGDHVLARQAADNKARELELYASADALVAVTESDREALLRELPGTDVYVLSNIHDVSDAPAGPEGRAGLLFVGNFMHTPNADAVRHLHDDVMPLVWAEEPGAQLTIAGYRPPASVEALASPRVTVTGQVPELEPYLSSHRVSVAPLRFGAGIKGKVCEALAAGLPVVTTPVGSEGMQLGDGGGGVLLEGADAPALAAQIVRALRDDDLWRSLQAAGRTWIEDNLSSTAAARALDALVQREAARRVDSELTSIVILVRDQAELTERCLRSIAAHTPERHELLLVDNGSGSETADLLDRWAREHEHVRVVRNADNRGFAAGNNQGLALARGGSLLLLNNDTEVTPGWLGRMHAALEQHPETGLVGPTSNRAAGPQQVDEPYGPGGHDALAAELAVRNAGRTEQVDRLVGFALLVRRAVVDAVGGLDERFGFGNFEDDDFTLRARLAGFGARVVLDSFVHHVGNQTFKSAGIEYQHQMLGNWQIFKQKWGLAPETTLAAGYELDEETARATVPLAFPLPAVGADHEPHGRVWEQTGERRLDASAEAAIRAGSVAGLRRAFAEAARWRDGHRRYQSRRWLVETALSTPQQGSAAWQTLFAAAADELLTVLDGNPAEPVFLNYAGILLYELTAFDGAEALFRAAGRLDPGLEHVEENLKAARKHKGRTRRLPIQGLSELEARARAVASKAKPAEGMTVSLCMIVKDEEEMLPGCLAPVAEHVDELIVVDTGSSDRTVEIAESFGAKVIHFPWNGSFSDARNVGLDAATGDWLLYLDADEHVVPGDAAKLRSLLGRTWREGFHLPMTNYTGGDESGPAVTHMALRMFRNRPEYRFVGRIHEQKTHAMPLFLAERWETAPVRMLHYGYLKSRVADKDKTRRNLELLEREAAESPTAFTSYNLGCEYARLADHEQARRHFEDAWARLGSGWSEVGYGSVLAVRLAVARRATGDLDGAAAAIHEGLRAFPDHTDLVLELAAGAHARGDLAEAERLARRCLEIGDAPADYIATVGAGTYLALALLAQIRRDGGDAAGAEEISRTSLAQHPDYVAPVLVLATDMLARGATSAEVDAIVPAGRPSAMMLAGTAFHEAGRVEDAERWFRATLERQPSNGLARVGLVEALLSQRRYAEAAAEAELEPAGTPFAAAAAGSGLFAHAAAGDAPALTAALDRAQEAGVVSGDLALYRGWAAALAGEPLPASLPAESAATALTVLEALLRIQDFDAFELVLPLFDRTELDAREKREALARTYLRRGFVDSAASEWIAVASERPDARAYVGLAQVAWARGLAEDALAFAEEALVLHPDDEEAALLRTNLLARAA